MVHPPQRILSFGKTQCTSSNQSTKVQKSFWNFVKISGRRNHRKCPNQSSTKTKRTWFRRFAKTKFFASRNIKDRNVLKHHNGYDDSDCASCSSECSIMFEPIKEQHYLYENNDIFSEHEWDRNDFCGSTDSSDNSDTVETEKDSDGTNTNGFGNLTMAELVRHAQTCMDITLTIPLYLDAIATDEEDVRTDKECITSLGISEPQSKISMDLRWLPTIFEDKEGHDIRYKPKLIKLSKSPFTSRAGHHKRNPRRYSLKDFGRLAI